METLDQNQSGEISEKAFKDLTDAAPWLKVMGIIGLVLGGLYVLGALFSLMASPVMGIFMLAVSALMLYMYLLLYKQGSSLGKYKLTKGSGHLETMAASYKMFWMLTVILTIAAFLIGLILAISGQSFVNSFYQMPMQ